MDAAEIVPLEVAAIGNPQVLPPFAKRIRQPRQAAHLHSGSRASSSGVTYNPPGPSPFLEPQRLGLRVVHGSRRGHPQATEAVPARGGRASGF